MEQPEVLFAQLKGDNEPLVIESLCTNCEKNGKTTMLLTNIPFFKDIIVISFLCEECGFKNSEIQFGGKLGPQGVKIVFTATTVKDLNRELIKSEFCRISIPEVDFEIPANKKGEVTTIEGLFCRCIDDLTSDQPVRKVMQPETYNKIEEFLEALNNIKEGKRLPFTVILDDPSGNSFIKNPLAPKSDPRLHYNYYNRTAQMMKEMGYSVENAQLELEEQQKIEIEKAKENAHKIDYTKPFDEGNFLKT